VDPPLLGFEVNTTVKKMVFFASVFWHMVLPNGFLIMVKELWLLTNLVQWIMGVDVAKSYIYCIVNNEEI
jgi:hypothetical protein